MGKLILILTVAFIALGASASDEGPLVAGTKRYYDNGQLSLEQVKGLRKMYYRDGTLQRYVPLKDNKIHGLATGYYEDGSLYYEARYKEGELKSLKLYDREGKLVFDDLVDY